MKNTDILIFADNLKKYRKKKKISQEELAIAVGTTKTSIYSYEKGTSYPNIEILCKICNVLFVTPNDLLLSENNMFFATNCLEPNSEPTKKQIAINLIQCLNIKKYFNYNFEDKKDLIHPSKINHTFSLDVYDEDIVSLVAYYLEEQKNNNPDYVKNTKKKLDELNHPDKNKNYCGFDEEY